MSRQSSFHAAAFPQAPQLRSGYWETSRTARVAFPSDTIARDWSFAQDAASAQVRGVEPGSAAEGREIDTHQPREWRRYNKAGGGPATKLDKAVLAIIRLDVYFSVNRFGIHPDQWSLIVLRSLHVKDEKLFFFYSISEPYRYEKRSEKLGRPSPSFT